MSERPRFRIGKQEFDDVQFFVEGNEFWLSRVWADSTRLDKVFQSCEIRYWYAAHPDCFETIETREAIDKLEEEKK